MLVAKILWKMALPGLTFGEHCVDSKQCANLPTMIVCMEVYHNRHNVHEKCGLAEFP